MNKDTCVINNWAIDHHSGSIQHIITGEKKRLGAYQLKLLDILQESAGKVFTREELTHLVWGRRVIGHNSLPNAIHALRVALEDDGKQQRIIRTIPKQGYMLEASYCGVVQQESQASFTATVANDDVEQAPEMAPLPDTTQRKSTFFARHVTGGKRIVILLLALLSLAVIGYSLLKRNQPATSPEVAKKNYSNIRLFALPEPGKEVKEQIAIFSTLKESYDILNQELNKKSSHMSIYYHAGNQILNYTLRLRNNCQQSFLVMEIDNWQTDPASLNKLILNETRRKLNEMAPCKA